jgi:hypothetical protein
MCLYGPFIWFTIKTLQNSPSFYSVCLMSKYSFQLTVFNSSRISNVTIFCDKRPSSLVARYDGFGGIYCLHRQAEDWTAWEGENTGIGNERIIYGATMELPRCFSHFLLLAYRWMRKCTLQHGYISTRLNVVTSQKAVTVIVTPVITKKPQNLTMFCTYK